MPNEKPYCGVRVREQCSNMLAHLDVGAGHVLKILDNALGLTINGHLCETCMETHLMMPEVYDTQCRVQMMGMS